MAANNNYKTSPVQQNKKVVGESQSVGPPRFWGSGGAAWPVSLNSRVQDRGNVGPAKFE